MIFSSIKGGEEAIEKSLKILAKRRRGDRSVPSLTVAQIREQMTLAVDRVMSEGSLYDPTLAALAIKQAEGDLMEATFLLRAYRTTLPRFGYTSSVDTVGMLVRRRIATTHKDVPGGQLLGPTYDYSHRLLDFSLLEGEEQAEQIEEAFPDDDRAMVPLAYEVGITGDVNLVQPDLPDDEQPVADLTRDRMSFPTSRDERLQNLARGDEGFMTALCYSLMRGYGTGHPFVAELRYGDVGLELEIPETGFSVEIGAVRLTECRTLHLYKGDEKEEPRYTRGYGLIFGQSDRKAIAMATIDRALRADEFGEERKHPVQDEEFVLGHSDSVATCGLVQHLKLPHYVDFQADLQMLQQMRVLRQERLKCGKREAAYDGEASDAE